MKRQWYGRRQIPREDGRTLEVEYWFLTEDTCWGESYGIALSDSQGEETVIRHITTCRKDAQLLLERLAQGLVTTVTAADLVEDYLAG